MGRRYKGGGSLTLASLIDKAGEAIYQDLRSEYGVSLVSMVENDVSPVEILMLIRGLGIGSRFIATLQGGSEFVSWDVHAYQMATVIDAINNVAYAVVASNSKRKPKAPKPTYRPKKGGRRSNNAFQQQINIAKQRKAQGR